MRLLKASLLAASVGHVAAQAGVIIEAATVVPWFAVKSAQAEAVAAHVEVAVAGQKPAVPKTSSTTKKITTTTKKTTTTTKKVTTTTKKITTVKTTPKKVVTTTKSTTTSIKPAVKTSTTLSKSAATSKPFSSSKTSPTTAAAGASKPNTSLPKSSATKPSTNSASVAPQKTSSSSAAISPPKAPSSAASIASPSDSVSPTTLRSTSLLSTTISTLRTVPASSALGQTTSAATTATISSLASTTITISVVPATTVTTTVSVIPTTTTTASTTVRIKGTPAVFADAPYPSNLSPKYYNFTGTSQYRSDHFMVWNTTSDVAANALRYLEGTYDCFVVQLGWRNPGVPFYDDPDYGPFYRVNQFITPQMPVNGASGVTTGDQKTGLGYTWLWPDSANNTGIPSHEFGHVLTFAQQQWWNQSRAMAWAETIAQFVDDSYVHGAMCAGSRALVNDTTGWTLFYADVTISRSYMTIIDASGGYGNQYQAWPWLLYLHTNPDNYAQLGNQTMLKLFQNYKVNSNETPFHTLDRIAAPHTSQELVGRYWAHMAWVDFNDYDMQFSWNLSRADLDYNNTYSVGTNVWRVLPAKQPLYMGASIIPLNTTANTGSLSVQVDGSSGFTATLAVRSVDNTVAYTVLVAGDVALSKTATVSLGTGQGAFLVVANTPDTLLNYDNWNITGPVAVGLDFNVTVDGASTVTGIANTPYCVYWPGGCDSN